jgi:genome maintenance exonuclease 1
MFIHNPYTFPELVQETTEESRVYVTPQGNRYASVTTVLSDYSKASIDQWKMRVGEETATAVSNKAKARGTAVHSAIEYYLNNQSVPSEILLPDVKSLYVRMKPELNRINNIRCLETRMYSDQLRLAGTVDCIGEYDGVLSVIDFKTSKKEKKFDQILNYFMQGSAYAEMFREHTGIKIDQIVILIGVDTTNQAQVFTVKADHYIDDLKLYIKKYYGD